MKLPLTLTFLILAAGSFWGLREQLAVTALREIQREIMRGLAAPGVFTDSSNPSTPGKIIRRAREDSRAKVKAYADRCVAFLKKMEEREKQGGNSHDAEMNKYILETLDGMYSFNGEELKILIAELRGRTDLSDIQRKNMIGFAVTTLAKRHPQAALAIITGSSDLLADPEASHTAVSSALSQWAMEQPLAAMEWIRQHAEPYPQLVNFDTKVGMVTGVARKDFGLALQLAGELRISVGTGPLMLMAFMANTPERKTELLAALRRQASLMTDKSKADELLTEGATCLFPRITGAGFDKSMAWLATSGLSDKEAADFRGCLHYEDTKADTGRWLEWISTQPEAGYTPQITRNLISEWTRNDYKAAGEWLANAPAGPMKDNATLTYLETIAPYDAETATQWAETLTGDKRADAMKRIHDVLKQKDKPAAQDFGKRHGLAEE